MITRIKNLLPTDIEPVAVKWWYYMRPVVKLIFFGRNRFCPVCESSTRLFLSHGPRTKQIKDIVCPVCFSHERHRLSWSFLNSHTNLNDGSHKKLLHFAPETEFARKFIRIPGIEYFSADLSSPHAKEKMDITDIKWPDDSFDIIYCCHILEHVTDDRRAMSEMYRVLKPGGWALIQVPISRDQNTFEDPSITDPAERERLFWWYEHVRLYGLDIENRLSEAGFHVDVVFGNQIIKPEDYERMRINPDEPLFYCKKTAPLQ